MKAVRSANDVEGDRSSPNKTDVPHLHVSDDLLKQTAQRATLPLYRRIHVFSLFPEVWPESNEVVRNGRSSRWTRRVHSASSTRRTLTETIHRRQRERAVRSVIFNRARTRDGDTRAHTQTQTERGEKPRRTRENQTGK